MRIRLLPNNARDEKGIAMPEMREVRRTICAMGLEKVAVAAAMLLWAGVAPAGGEVGPDQCLSSQR